MRHHHAPAAIIAALVAACSPAALAQLSTTFTYQGELRVEGQPASGAFDLRFRLFDAASGGTQVGPTLCVDNQPVADARFTTLLDFGNVLNGQDRFLEIDVRADTGQSCANSAGFTTLAGRQPLTATPYASFATIAANAAAALNATLLNAQPAAYYTSAANITGTLPDARLSTNVSLLAGPQTFTGLKTFSAAPTFSAAGSPFLVASTTRVNNLNADLLDGLDSTAFALTAHTHDAAALVSGTLADARIPASIPRLNLANTFTSVQTLSSTVQRPLIIQSTSVVGASLTLRNTSGATNEWTLTATGSGSTEGAGRMLLQRSSGGTRVTVDDAGFVGIGTSTPLAELHVANSIGNADLLLKRNDAPQGFNFGVSAAPKLFIARTDGSLFTDVFTIDGTTDRVGIGAITPDSRLDVRAPAGEDPLRLRVDGATKFRVYSNGGVSIGANPAAPPADGLFVNGRVGIGTFSPLSLLHAESATVGIVLRGVSTLPTAGIGVFGRSTGSSGFGVYGEADTTSTEGRGVSGRALASTGVAHGVYAQSDSTTGRGITALATATFGVNFGVYASTNSGDGVAIYALNTETQDGAFSVALQGNSVGRTGRGLFASASNTSGVNYGVQAASFSTAGFDFHAVGAGLDYGSSSSRRWKSDIRSIDDPLATVARLRGVYFTWDAEHGGHQDIGFIAEDVGAVLPEIVRFEENSEHAAGMDYARLTPLLVEAVNALRQQNDDLRARNADLEARLDAIEQALRDLGIPTNP